MLRKLILIVALCVAVAAQAQTLRVEIRGELKDDSLKTKTAIIKTQMLLPSDQTREIFCGPHTIKLSVLDPDSGAYAIVAEIFGLGPEYYSSEYKINLAINDPMPIPPAPVKGNIKALYTLTILDDTSQVQSAEPDQSDTTVWGVSESIHYRTHWLKGSYADFNWNLRMGYLELIYDKYRYSYSLSSSEKIDIYFHPNNDSNAFIDSRQGFAIYPRSMRIDAIFGQEMNTVTPQPAAELLMYRLWGYGPRWMVTGFARYYTDDLLLMRDMAAKYKSAALAKLFSDTRWLESDTGRIITGAFCHYLVSTYPIAKFMELYKQATDLNFQAQFEKVYRQSFDKVLTTFLEYSKQYNPKEGEIEFYASLYMRQGEYEMAAKYLEEAKKFEDLALCKFWLGDYTGAAKEISYPNPFTIDCARNMGLANYRLAAGEFKKSNDGVAKIPFTSILGVAQICPQAKIQAASMLLDENKISLAAMEIDSIRIEDIKSPDYFIESGRLRLIKSESADSLLTIAASIALEQATSQPQEPISYLYAGQAFMYLKDFDRAEENLNTAYFLEKRPYFVGCILLELGRLMDLQGKRDEANTFYGQILEIKAGAYQKYLAEKYLVKEYSLNILDN